MQMRLWGVSKMWQPIKVCNIFSQCQQMRLPAKVGNIFFAAHISITYTQRNLPKSAA